VTALTERCPKTTIPYCRSEARQSIAIGWISRRQTDVRSFHIDNRVPGERAEFLSFGIDVLLTADPSLIVAERISQDVVDESMRRA
jgi:hypothetical protein